MKHIFPTKRLSAFLLLFVPLWTAACLMACSSDDNDETGGTNDSVFSVPNNLLTSGLSVSNGGGAETFVIQSSSAVEVTSSETWCVATGGSPSAGSTDVTISLNIEANSELTQRTAVLTLLNAEDKIAHINVTQAAGELPESLTLERTSYQVAAEGGALTVGLEASDKVTYSIGESWISRAVASYSVGDTRIHFSVERNTGAERTATITFRCGELSETVSVTQAAATTRTPGIGGSTPQEVAASMGLGWNLGNQLDAHNNGVASETSWGNEATTQALFDALAEQGFTSVRIPVTWMGNIGEAPDYTIAPAYLDRVAEVVGYAEQAGLNAIINIHHDGADSQYWLNIKNAAADETANTAIKEQLAAMWTQIANRLADKGDFLMFESMNEIHDGSWGWGDNRNDGGRQYRVLNEWNQTFVDAVRATGGNNATRYLGVPGYVCNIDLTVENFQLPTDPTPDRLMVAVHFYDPNEYTLTAKYSEWGHTGTDKESWGDESNVTGQFAKMKSTFIDQGIPAYIGEMGCVHRSSTRAEKFRLYYLEYVCKAAKDYALPTFYWDNGSKGSGAETSGLFNHATGQLLNNAQDVIDVMKRAVFTDNADYTLDTVYDSAP